VSLHRYILVLAGAVATSVISFTSVMAHGPSFIADVEAGAESARDAAGGQGIAMRFTTQRGWLTRHPVLSGGNRLPPFFRARAAAAIAHSPGVGGVRWQPDPNRITGAYRINESDELHCQDKVEAILRARSIRFADASAAIDPASNVVLDEVASALRPCVGSIIAIIGHTDASGSPATHRALSQQRAEAVRMALIRRGIPADGLRARGEGANHPLEGLDPYDAANRRIEFSVISVRPLHPTPVDTPDAG
jgi:OOP family OmpA-OmpF porin